MMVILAYLSEIQSQYPYFGTPIDHLWKGPQVQWLHTTACAPSDKHISSFETTFSTNTFGLVQKKVSAQNQFANPAEIIKFQSFLTLLTTLLVNFDKEPGDIMVLEYCHESKEGQGTPFEAFGTSLYFKKVSAQKVPNREIRGWLL